MSSIKTKIVLAAKDEATIKMFDDGTIDFCMHKTAADHFRSLLERYNWSISERLKHYRRWRKFWPGLLQIERTLVVMFVSSSNNGMFRGPLLLDARDYESPRFSTRFKRLEPCSEVAQEFHFIHHLFIQNLLTFDDVMFKFYETHPSVMQVYKTSIENTVKQWLDRFDSIHLDTLLFGSLTAAGMSREEANTTSVNLALQVTYLVNSLAHSFYLTKPDQEGWFFHREH
jgi:hypothetical protein